MTLKCALAGLDAGGGKAVVLDHAGLDRPRAFERLGRFVQELGGQFRTAGDLGTTETDLKAMARTCQYVHLGEAKLAEAVARGALRCMEACNQVHGGAASVSGLSVAVQGCGSIGSALARRLVKMGAQVVVADLDPARAAALGCAVCEPSSVLTQEVDIVAPCAVGGVITTDNVGRLRAWAVCGAANNILADADTARALQARNVLFVPDVVASAGAVIEGIGRSVMLLEDPAPLIDALADTARRILEHSARTGDTPDAVARRLAEERLA